MTKITKTNDEWKKYLSEDSYKVTRESGTERPYTGKYWDFNDSLGRRFGSTILSTSNDRTKPFTKYL